ncbi:MAG TPA: hypothetical protein VF210_00585, partial [Pseudomonadales bacterium]
MDRRTFVRLLAAMPLVPAAADPPQKVPRMRVVTPYTPAQVPGMPGPWPGTVVKVSSAACVDTATGAANAEVVKEMMA